MLIIAILLIFFCPTQIVFSFRAHWIVLLYALLLCALPFGNQRIGELKKFKPIQWLGIIFLFQVILALSFYGIYSLTMQAMPIIHLPNMAFSAVSYHFLIQWGLFPFGLFILLAARMAKVGFIKKQRGLLSVATASLLKNTITDDVGVSIDSFMRLTIISAFAMTGGFLALIVMELMHDYLQLPLMIGPKFGTLILCTLIIMLVTSQYWQKTLRRISSWPVPSLCIIAIVIITVVATIFIGSFVINTIEQNAPVIKTPFSLFNTPRAVDYWFILIAFWGLAWLPIYAGIMAYISQGYKIRSMIVANLILPMIAGILVYLTVIQQWPINSINKDASLWLGLIGMTLIFSLLFREKWLTPYMRATVPDTEFLKKRPRHRFIQNLAQTIGMLISIYLLSGSIMPGFLMFIILLPGFIIAFMTVIN